MKLFINSSNVDSMVGAAGFEPTISCSQSRRATKLRHTPWKTDRAATGTFGGGPARSPSG